MPSREAPARQEHRLRAVVNRVLGDHGPPAHDVVGKQRETVDPPVGEHDARGMDAEPLPDQLAQRHIARAGAVREDRLAVARERCVRAVGELLDGEQVGGEAVGREAKIGASVEKSEGRLRRKLLTPDGGSPASGGLQRRANARRRHRCLGEANTRGVEERVGD